MDNIEAIYIRNRFKSTKGYNELIRHLPKLEIALNKLPDESFMVFNPMIMEMYQEARKEYRQLIEGDSRE